MTLEAGRLFETLWAHFTVVRPFIRVNMKMFFEAAGTYEAFGTNSTLERSLV